MARKTKRESRRKPGTGTIRHKPARQAPWEAEWRHSTGEPEYRSFTEHAQAAKWLDELVAKREAGKDTTTGAMIFNDLVDRWLSIKQPKVAAKTFLTYSYYGKLAVSDDVGIGRVKIDSLDLNHMETLLAALLRGKYKCTGAVFRMLRSVFKYARSSSLRWMQNDPLDGLNIPAIRQRENQVLSKKARERLFETARRLDETDCPLLPLWHLYSRLGLRKGEGIALKWTDIDWDEKILTIDESTTNVGPDNITGETKGRKVRHAPIPDDVLDLLKEHRAAQLKRGIFTAVFADKHGEEVTPQHVQYRWSKLRKEAGCPKTTLHDLRHTALTLLALDGTPQNVLMALAGHLSPAISRLYTNHAGVEDVRRFVG